MPLFPSRLHGGGNVEERHERGRRARAVQRLAAGGDDGEVNVMGRGGRGSTCGDEWLGTCAVDGWEVWPRG